MFEDSYLVMERGSCTLACGSGWRGSDTMGPTLATPGARLMLFATPSERMIWVPGVMGVPGGGAEV